MRNDLEYAPKLDARESAKTEFCSDFHEMKENEKKEEQQAACPADTSMGEPNAST